MKFRRTIDDWTLFGSIFDKIGRRFLSTIFGQQLLLFFRTLHSVFAEGRNFCTDLRTVIRQIYFTVVEVFPVLLVVAVLTGTVTIVEAMTVMPRVGFSDAFGGLMVVVLVREIGSGCAFDFGSESDSLSCDAGPFWGRDFDVPREHPFFRVRHLWRLCPCEIACASVW